MGQPTSRVESTNIRWLSPGSPWLNLLDCERSSLGTPRLGPLGGRAFEGFGNRFRYLLDDIGRHVDYDLLQYAFLSVCYKRLFVRELVLAIISKSLDSLKFILCLAGAHLRGHSPTRSRQAPSCSQMKEKPIKSGFRIRKIRLNANTQDLHEAFLRYLEVMGQLPRFCWFQ
jgi:hypothetical protein